MEKKIKISPSLPAEDAFVRSVIEYLGYPSAARACDEVKRALKEIYAALPGLLDLKYACRTSGFTGCDEKSVTFRDFSINSKKLEKLVSSLDDPKEALVFMLTLGDKFDKEVARLGDKDINAAYLLESSGAVLAEYFADLLAGEISRECKFANLETTGRFSPGYCDWETGEGQKALYDFLRPGFIELTSSAMMSPKKSVSAVMISARKAASRNACAFCDKKNCPHRRP